MTRSRYSICPCRQRATFPTSSHPIPTSTSMGATYFLAASSASAAVITRLASLVRFFRFMVPTLHHNSDSRRHPVGCYTGAGREPARQSNRSPALHALLQPHHYAVRRTPGVHHGETYESWAIRREEDGSLRTSTKRRTVDQHGERRGAACDLQRQRIDAAVLARDELEPGAIGRKQD